MSIAVARYKALLWVAKLSKNPIPADKSPLMKPTNADAVPAEFANGCRAKAFD